MGERHTPDFFIVGAPKCGTTALHQYLRAHPDIYIPAQKEVAYLASDLTEQRAGMALSEQAFFNLFEKRKDEKRVGVAWVLHLYSKRSALEIRELSPNADIIVMLRNPVEMVYSYHSQLLYHGLEDIADFESALNAESHRKLGNMLPKWLPYPAECLFYSDIVQFAEQLERYFTVFGRDRVRVILYDDFRDATASEYRKTLRFLGVEEDFTPEFKIVNPNSKARNVSLQRFLITPPSLIRLAYRFMPDAVRKMAHNTRLRVMRVNTKRVERKAMGAELKERLTQQYAPGIRRLETLIGRDLSHWTPKPEMETPHV